MAPRRVAPASTLVALASTLAALASAFAAPASTLAAPAGASAPADVGSSLVLGERQPIVMLVFTPKAATGAGPSTSDLFRAAAAALEPKTDFALSSPERIGVDQSAISGCSDHNRLSCWVRAVRRQGLTGGTTTDARFLIALGVHPEAAGTHCRLSAMLIDTDAALALLERADRTAAGWEDAIEDQIFTEALRTAPVRVKLSDPAGLERYFGDLFLTDFRSTFEREGHFEPYGELVIEVDPAGLLIELDGKPIGATRQGSTRVLGILPGARAVSLVDRTGRYEQVRSTVTIDRGETATFTPELELRADPLQAGVARKLTFWSGVGLTVAGAAITAMAVLAPRESRLVDACSGGGCARGEAGFASVCEVVSSDPSCLVGDKGLLAAPLGYSLVLAGGAWAAGTELVDHGEVPWIALAVGVLAGAAAYGASVALDPR